MVTDCPFTQKGFKVTVQKTVHVSSIKKNNIQIVKNYFLVRIQWYSSLRIVLTQRNHTISAFTWPIIKYSRWQLPSHVLWWADLSKPDVSLLVAVTLSCKIHANSPSHLQPQPSLVTPSHLHVADHVLKRPERGRMSAEEKDELDLKKPPNTWAGGSLPHARDADGMAAGWKAGRTWESENREGLQNCKSELNHPEVLPWWARKRQSSDGGERKTNICMSSCTGAPSQLLYGTVVMLIVNVARGASVGFNVSHDQHKIKKVWVFWFLQVYLISASRLVMATPTLDRASDVTWPAWERVARVLTHLRREEKNKRVTNTKNGGWMCCCLGIFLLRELSQAVRLLTGHQSHLSWEIPSLVP